MNLEELTKMYSDACMRAVEDAIHELTNKWDSKVVDLLNAGEYHICAELYGDSLSILAYIGKDGYYGYERYLNSDMQCDVQEVFDKLGAQVVLNAMVYCGWEETTQTITWEIK